MNLYVPVIKLQYLWNYGQFKLKKIITLLILGLLFFKKTAYS